MRGMRSLACIMGRGRAVNDCVALLRALARAPTRALARARAHAHAPGGTCCWLQWWAAELGEQLPAPVARLGPTRVDFKYPKVRPFDCVCVCVRVFVCVCVCMCVPVWNALAMRADIFTAKCTHTRSHKPQAERAPSSVWGYAASQVSALAAAANAHDNGGGGGGGPSRQRLAGAADVSSLVDFLLHTELACDYDGYVSSVFFYKVCVCVAMRVAMRDGGRVLSLQFMPRHSTPQFHQQDAGKPLTAGPVWDKNLAFGNEAEVRLGVELMRAYVWGRVGACGVWASLCGCKRGRRGELGIATSPVCHAPHPTSPHLTPPHPTPPHPTPPHPTPPHPKYYRLQLTPLSVLR